MFSSLLRTRIGVAAAVAVLALLVVGPSGFLFGYRYARAIGEAKLVQAHADHAEFIAELNASRADAERDARARLQAEQRRANVLAESLIATEAQLAEAQHQLKRRIKRVTTVYRPAPDAPPQPVPAPVFTWGFVRLLNDAIGAGAGDLPAAGATAGAAQAPGATEAAHAGLLDDLAPSGVTPEDLLAHLVDYAARCRAIEAQLSQLISYHEGRRVH